MKRTLQARTMCAVEVAAAAFWGYTTPFVFSRPLGWTLAIWVVATVALVASVVFFALWVDAARELSYWTGRRDEALESLREAQRDV